MELLGLIKKIRVWKFQESIKSVYQTDISANKLGSEISDTQT